jgi:tight adherence protein B
VNLELLLVLVFVATLGLVMSAIYFFFAAPAEKKQVRDRLEALRELARAEGESLETQLLRQEVLSGVPAMHRLLMKLPGTKELNLFIQQSAADITVGMLLLLALLIFAFVFLLCLVVGLFAVLALLLAVMCAGIPFLYISIKRQRRFFRFEELFPDAMDLLARAVRAGHAFTSGLEMIAKEMPAPLSEEFRRTYEQQNLGLPLRDALENMARRMPLPDVRIFVTALLIQRESGGNLAEILDNLSGVIRERFKLMRQIRVFTAQGRLTLYVLIALPPFVALLIFFLNRNYLMLLFTEPLGHRFLIAGIILQVLGFFVIRKIVQPKI